jgi:hypothetical protein
MVDQQKAVEIATFLFLLNFIPNPRVTARAMLVM